MKVLVVGPSPIASRGGMATVIEEIEKDKKLSEEFEIDIFESYIDGGKVKVLLFSIYAFLKFYFFKRNYDIYHIHAASYGSTFRKGFYVRAAKKWGKKVILHIHGAEYMVFYEKSKKKNQIISILNSADMVIALSKDWKKKFEKVFGITNCVVLENGINTDRLKEAAIEPKENPHTLVMLGRLGERKGTYDLMSSIEMAKQIIPDIKCYLAGDGEIERCKAIVVKKNLQKNIEIVGWADFNKKVSLLKKASVLVLPSYNEGLPMAILEGMACGKVIISTTVGAIPEVVTDNNGILVEPGDVAALTSAIIKCCTETDFAQEVFKNNIEKIRSKFSMIYMHGKLAEYYYKVMEC